MILHYFVDSKYVLSVYTTVAVDIIAINSLAFFVALHELVDSKHVLSVDRSVAVDVFNLSFGWLGEAVGIHTLQSGNREVLDDASVEPHFLTEVCRVVLEVDFLAHCLTLGWFGFKGDRQAVLIVGLVG